MALHRAGIVWATPVYYEGRATDKRPNYLIGPFGPGKKGGHL